MSIDSAQKYLQSQYPGGLPVTTKPGVPNYAKGLKALAEAVDELADDTDRGISTLIEKVESLETRLDDQDLADKLSDVDKIEGKIEGVDERLEDLEAVLDTSIVERDPVGALFSVDIQDAFDEIEKRLRRLKARTNYDQATAIEELRNVVSLLFGHVAQLKEGMEGRDLPDISENDPDIQVATDTMEQAIATIEEVWGRVDEPNIEQLSDAVTAMARVVRDINDDRGVLFQYLDHLEKNTPTLEQFDELERIVTEKVETLREEHNSDVGVNRDRLDNHDDWLNNLGQLTDRLRSSLNSHDDLLNDLIEENDELEGRFDEWTREVDDRFVAVADRLTKIENIFDFDITEADSTDMNLLQRVMRLEKRLERIQRSTVPNEAISDLDTRLGRLEDQVDVLRGASEVHGLKDRVDALVRNVRRARRRRDAMEEKLDQEHQQFAHQIDELEEIVDNHATIADGFEKGIDRRISKIEDRLAGIEDVVYPYGDKRSLDDRLLDIEKKLARFDEMAASRAKEKADDTDELLGQLIQVLVDRGILPSNSRWAHAPDVPGPDEPSPDGPQVKLGDPDLSMEELKDVARTVFPMSDIEERENEVQPGIDVYLPDSRYSGFYVDHELNVEEKHNGHFLKSSKAARAVEANLREGYRRQQREEIEEEGKKGGEVELPDPNCLDLDPFSAPTQEWIVEFAFGYQSNDAERAMDALTELRMQAIDDIAPRVEEGSNEDPRYKGLLKDLKDGYPATPDDAHKAPEYLKGKAWPNLYDTPPEPGAYVLYGEQGPEQIVVVDFPSAYYVEDPSKHDNMFVWKKNPARLGEPQKTPVEDFDGQFFGPLPDEEQ